MNKQKRIEAAEKSRKLRELRKYGKKVTTILADQHSPYLGADLAVLQQIAFSGAVLYAMSYPGAAGSSSAEATRAEEYSTGYQEVYKRSRICC